MSEFREDLLVTAINKKRVIKIILTAVLLVFAFAFSTVFFSFLWNTIRPPPSSELAGADEEEGIPTQIPFPYNMSDFQDLFSDLNLTTDELTDLLDALTDMFDGDIDDLDLGDYGAALAALMFSEVEVFRIYDYDDYNEILTKFWKYESFDEYTGDGWHSSAATTPYSYYTYGDYFSQHWDKDILSLKIPLTPVRGINSMVIPTLFHTPFIMENSIQANNMQGIPNLFKDEFNCTTLDIDFSMDEDVNMTYEMFGLNLPTSSEIDAVAIEPFYTPVPIKSKYLQLKGDTINVYISNNDDFAYHYNQINATILSSDNAFIVADKIRNYLQYNFIRISDPSQYNPAPDGYDQVEWFLEEGIGYWSDFTSAFCAFARAFGIASRFVDGFNSFLAEEQFDNFEGRNAVAIKYKNMYNWAEIYIPTDVSGNGIWIQMDVYYDNYGSVPPSLANYSLTLNSNFTAGFRGTTANLTASLTLDGAPVEGATISFYDLTSLQTLGQFDTNLGGNASIIVNIDDLQVVGPHLIFAQFNPDVNDTTTYTIYGDIQVNLQYINPQEVNISIDTSTNIQGYVADPVNSKRVSGVTVEFVILQKGTSTRVGTPPFDTSFVLTDSNGVFNADVNIDVSVPVGKYELRVDTNGSWYYNPYALGFVNDSSNKMDLNVTKGIVKKLWFYINDIPSDIPDAPIVKRNSNITLKAIVVNETNAPISNQNVDFYDYTRGVYIGSNITNSNGIATLNYFIGNFVTIGPNLLYGKLGINENFTYFILNEEPTINIISGPTPREINSTVIGATNTFFNIEGRIIDSINNNPIRRSRLNLKLMNGVMDYSVFLIPSEPFLTDFNGYFNLNFEVDSNAPTGNYTLRLDFNGTINRLGHPEYPAFFILPYINTSSVFTSELKISTPATLLFNFWINGTVFDDYNQPVLSKNEDLNLSVYLEWGAIPIGDGEWIDFYDVTQDVALGSAQTINGYSHFVYSTSTATVAGPHLIYARWGSNYNYSYYIYNKNITIDLTDGPEPREVDRSGPIVSRSFNLHGYVNDSSNGVTIKYAQINVYMFDGLIDVSFYLVLQGGSTSMDETGEFNLDYYISSSTPDKNYTIRVEFSGVFLYSWPNNQFNEHDFYLGAYSNFTDLVIASYELQVIDLADLKILLSVEGSPTLSFYDDANPPETFKFGEITHIQVQIIHAGTKDGNTVYLYDDFTNTLITSWVFEGESGFIQFNISTDTLHAGLIRFRVNYESYNTFNTTYIVINETIPISINLDRNVVERNFHQFNVNGILQQNGTNLDGLVIGLFLFNSTPLDTSFYLNLNGPQFRTVSNGFYSYDINSIFLSCPQGSYIILIYFTGNINEMGISLTSYMDTSMSMILPINITAGTAINGEYDTNIVKDDFYDGDDLYVYGFLTWDNGTAMSSMEINVTVRDSIGNILGTAIRITDGSGFFNVTIVIGSWPANAEIWVTFYPEDNFSSPDYYYIEFYEIELFRAP